MNDYEDKSNVDMEATYQCEGCKETMPGKHLLPIVYAELMEDPNDPKKIIKTGKLKCNIRRCCFCRGTVKKLAK